MNEVRPCRACGTAILFVATRDGKKAPVDADVTVVMTPAGDAVRGHRSHFATCPKAADFRKGRT